MLIIRELTIATRNKGKLAEIEGLLTGMPVMLRTLAEFDNIGDVEETGSTFAANAELKAREYARRTGTITLADDSGLEIDALGGRPGVLSARYAGEDTGFAEKMAFVLDELQAAGDPERRARFVCSIAIADADGAIVFRTDGVCEGRIAFSPRGSGGFGFDPIFIPHGFDSTFGELQSAIKQKISHRARALTEIIPFLRDNMAI